MLIKDLIQLEMFNNCELLTGDIGLDNRVETAMILEATDIEKWGQKNQLILTSFYAFSDDDQQSSHTFFEKIKAIGISGIVIKIDRLIHTVPEWFVEQCVHYCIPLIKIEKGISYEKILVAIYGPLINKQATILKSYYEANRQFSALDPAQSSFHDIMTLFHTIMRKQCRLCIPDKQIEIIYGNKEKFSYQNEQLNRVSSSYIRHHYFIIPSSPSQRTVLLFESNHVLVNNFTLEVILDSDTITDSDLMIVENLVNIIQNKLQVSYMFKEQRYTQLNSMAGSILQNTFANYQELDLLLTETEMNDYDYYQMIAFPNNQFTGPNKMYVHSLRNRLRGLYAKHIFYENGLYTILLFNLKSMKQLIRKPDVKRVCGTIDAHNIAISDVVTKERIRELLPQCLDVLKFNRLFPIDFVVENQELGVFRLFTQMELADLLAIIPDKLLSLQREKEDLFQTLAAFLNYNKNFNATAQALFIHPKTVRYRVQKAEEYLAVKFDGSFNSLNYELSINLLRFHTQ